jgi:hypothetical protein
MAAKEAMRDNARHESSENQVSRCLALRVATRTYNRPFSSLPATFGPEPRVSLSEDASVSACVPVGARANRRKWADAFRTALEMESPVEALWRIRDERKYHTRMAIGINFLRELQQLRASNSRLGRAKYS